jgi:cysteine desulfurase
MLRSMDVVGNPSSVHTEGRAAKATIETARTQIAQAIGASNADIVFTSGATEAAALALRGRDLVASGLEHDAVTAWITPSLLVKDGRVGITEAEQSVLQLANSETGLIQDVTGVAVSDITQGFGRVPFAFDWSGVGMAFLSAHKFGGPKGIGALIMPAGTDLAAQIKGGGQEMGRRAGTENIIGIAGMGAAAEAAQKDLANGRWDQVAQFRNILEKAIETEAPDTIFVAQDMKRLPNTSCFLTQGWKGETQVMAMDLAGFAISAGSACSSGKTRGSRVLQTLGYADELASCAIRVSLGLNTTKDDVLRFAQAWTAKRNRKMTAA